MNSYSVIVDIILVGIILSCVLRAYGDGFFTSAVKLAGSVGSLFAAWYVASNYAQMVFDKILRDVFISRSSAYLQKLAQNVDVKTAITNIIGQWPNDFLNTLFEKFSINTDSLATILTPTAESAVYLVDRIIAPVVIVVLQMVMYILCYIAVRCVCNVMASVFKVINKVPLLGTANKLAGGVAGIAIAGVNIIILSSLLSIIVVLSGNGFEWLNTEVIEGSKILAITMPFNPFLK